MWCCSVTYYVNDGYCDCDGTHYCTHTVYASRRGDCNYDDCSRGDYGRYSCNGYYDYKGYNGYRPDCRGCIGTCTCSALMYDYERAAGKGLIKWGTPGQGLWQHMGQL